KVTGATNYRYQLMKGATTVYTKTVAAGVCGASTCASTPPNVLGPFAYKWRIQAMVGGVWRANSAYTAFTISPATIAPKGTIADTTPTYKWAKIAGATQYRYQLVKSGVTVYTKTVPASVCGATTCANTPINVLGAFTYSWRVQAMVGGVWGVNSAYTSFTIPAPVAVTPGFWSGSGLEFYVLSAGPVVDDFAIYIYVNGCGNYKITRTTSVPIVNKSFSFTGSFYANGTFPSATTAQGALGLSSFYIPGCGYVSGGPFSWTATWKHSALPIIVIDEGDTSTFTVSPELDTPFNAFTVEPE
ncbi:MAG: hypothetical protein AABZ00_02060, partial [Chloroflexota bacterium]